jgi:hypothetical protein
MLSRPALGFTQPPIQSEPGAISPGVKQPVLEADHSPPTSADVKKMRIYIPEADFMVPMSVTTNKNEIRVDISRI